MADLDRHKCTIEEREEYEPHVRRGNTIFAGVDYERILHQAEKISDIIVWDGGNNDLPFYRSDLHIVVVDPFRVGDETLYHPGEANVRFADVIIINKVGTGVLLFLTLLVFLKPSLCYVPTSRHWIPGRLIYVNLNFFIVRISPSKPRLRIARYILSARSRVRRNRSPTI